MIAVIRERNVVRSIKKVSCVEILGDQALIYYNHVGTQPRGRNKKTLRYFDRKIIRASDLLRVGAHLRSGYVVEHADKVTDK